MPASSVRSGGAYVEMFVKSGTVNASLDRVKRQLVSFGSSLRTIGLGGAGLGTAISAPLLASVASFAAAGSELNDLSAQTGIATEDLQTLGYVAAQTGSDTDSLVGAIGKMQKLLANNPEGAAKSLARLGLTLDSLRGKSPDQQFRMIARAMAGITDPATRAGIAAEIFGKSASNLIQMLTLGSALEETEQRLRDIGAVMSDEDVQAADTLGDRLDDLWASIARGKNIIGAALAPALTQFVNGTISAVSAATKWLNENRGLVLGLSAIGAVLLTVGGTLLATGIAIQIIGFAVGGLATAWMALGAVITSVGGAMAFVASSPVLLIVAGLAAVTAAVFALTGTFGSIVSSASATFGQLGGIVTQAMDGISNALAAGNIQAAVDVLWSGINLAWLTGTQSVSAIWSGMIDALSAVVITSVATIQSVWSGLWFGMQAAVEETQGFFSQAFQGIGNIIQSTLLTAKEYFFGFAASSIAALEKLVLYMTNILPRSAGAFQAKLDEIEARRKANAGTESIAKERADLAESQGDSGKTLQEDIDAKRAARIKASEESQAAITAERDGALKANEEIATAKRKQQEESLQRAQEEFDEATKAAESLNTPFVGPKQDKLAAAADGVAGAGGGNGFSLGSFSARNAGQQSIGGFGDIKKPIEDTAENTAELVAQGRNRGEVEFA